jgi:CRISPR/Cas system-associated exonuclease Cas4 (RecB family)
MLDQVLDRVAARYRDDLAPAIERIWQDELEGLRADLRGWLRVVAEKEGNWKPIRFEFGFGLPRDEHLDAASTVDPVALAGGYLLHGIVDVIEERADDSELRVTDHKTGRDWTPAGLVVGGGEILQPTLYGMAVEVALGRRVVEGRLFYSTAAGRYSERAVELGPMARAYAETVLRTIDGHIATPFLVPAPKPGACSRCDFREVCGPYEELRVARKSEDRLVPLSSLRALP